MPGLFDPLEIGDLRLPNRITMAPMTRTRAPGPSRVPNSLMTEYYAQRASAGLIVSQGMTVGPMAVGYKAAGYTDPSALDVGLMPAQS
jgi:2,4-dienoyl-CoA reductase-like NADH-dependent reductase (Old Yellow Enzyme family)